MRRLLAAIVALLLAGCAGQATAPLADRSPPKLLVLLVVDGLPQRQVVDYREQLAPDGFARFLDRGAWFSEAHYGSAATVTAVGHVAMVTGAYPHRTGIIGNEWRNRVTGEEEYCLSDPEYGYIGHKTQKLDGTSPRKLKVETFGDVLRAANPASKVVSISGKDRGAIPAGGHTGTAYVYQATTGQFASTTYYMKEHPGWVTDFNAARLADRYFRIQWKPVLPEAAYARSLPDGQKWYAKGGKLPKAMGEGMDKPGPAFYEALLSSPFADDLTLEFARAAIEGEGLGRDAAPDILAVSLSSHDYINHEYSAESRLSHDHVLQLDRALQDFFNYLDAKVGREAYVAVLTADHGFMPAPELSRAQGRNAGRVNLAQMLGRLNKALSARFGEGPLARLVTADSIALDRDRIAARGAVFDSVAEEARRLLMAEPAVQVAYTAAQLQSGSANGQPLFESMERAWNRDVSGDVDFALKPYWMVGGAPATHGSAHEYDTHVPLLMYGPPWIPAVRIDTRVDVIDLAPTLARLLRIRSPAASEGKPLPLP